jgi:hypothetical protein
MTKNIFRRPRELLRMLSESIERSFVEEIPDIWKEAGRYVRWFREKSTDVVYALEEPNASSKGTCWELEPKELFPEARIAPIGCLSNECELRKWAQNPG